MNIESQQWYVHGHRCRQDYVKIENLEQWLVKEVPDINPNHPKYTEFWSRQAKRCIEGLWGKEFGKWRYMPGNLYFFGNFGVLEHTWEDDRGVKITEDIKPYIVDFIWDYAYQSWIARGFSGFEKDDDVSCHLLLQKYEDNKLSLSDLPKTCISSNGKPKKYKDAFEYLLELHDKNLGKSLFQNPTVNYGVLGSRGSCHTAGTKIRMFDGTLKNVEDIDIGEQVMGVDSEPRNVLDLYRGEDIIFKVEQKHGMSYNVTGAHRIPCYRMGCHINIKSGNTCSSKEDIQFPTASELFNRLNSTKGKKPKSYIGFSECNIEYPEQNVKYDPYWLGLWLGDGFKKEKMICVAPEETQIIAWLKNYANENNWPYTITESKSGLTDTFTYRIRLKRTGDESTKKSWFGKTLANNKHIPHEYMINSRENRLKLLAGMIDSDGSYEKKSNRFTISGVDLALLKQFQIVAKSLGFKAVINKPSISGLTNSLKYNLRIYGKLTEIPTLLPRKKALQDSKSSYGFFRNVKKSPSGSNLNKLSLTSLGTAPYYGIELDGDNLYLLEDYSVTSNCKSYWSAIGELEYNFVFAGAQRYDEKYINNEYKCEQCAGAHEVTKSAEMVSKFQYSQKCKTDASKEKFRKWFGIWVEQDYQGNVHTTPSPFYKHHVGNLECPNKETPYTAVLKQKVNGKWVENIETSTVAHVNYSDKKLGGERAAEGGRYLYSVVEEAGSASNLVAIIGANEGTLSRGGVRIGYQAVQGTSGNLISVQSVKKVFLDPRSYNMIPHKNVASVDGVNGETCYFVPYHITLFQFKDKNGNTDFKKALDYVNEERYKLSQSKDPKVLRDFMMNKPCYVHEMWITDSGYYLPYEEASERERELMVGQNYKTLATPVEFYWDEKHPKGVNYKVLHDIEPIFDWPLPKELKDPSGCVVIYEQPVENPPHDLYIYSCDPYVEEDIDRGGSLAVTYIIKNPKYVPLGYIGHFIVASYIGKPSKGLSYYYEQQEKLFQYYSNNIQSIWYDARGGGETLRDYYIRQGKQYMLCIRPNHTKGDAMYEKHLTTHGVVIGNKDSKKTVLKLTHDKLLEAHAVINEDGSESIKRNIFRIPCIFLIRQIMQYNLDDNFDAASSFYIGIIGLNETEAKIEKALKNKRKVNIFEGLLNNKNIFKQSHQPYKESELVPSQY